MSAEGKSAVEAQAYDSHSAFDTLLLHLFDYAGMFPPAQRSFEDALKESASLPSSLRRPWLVGSDIVLDVANALKVKDSNLSECGFSRGMTICLLATEPLGNVEGVIRSLKDSSLPIQVASIELKVPSDGANEEISTWYPLAESCGALLALEPDLSVENWEGVLNEAISAIADSKKKIALKCRLTGPTGIGPEKLAVAISKVSEAGIHFKVTGGLHHPIVDPQLHAYPMGFVNVAAAVMLKRTLLDAISTSQLVDLLTNASWSRFSWSSGLSFSGLSISLSQLKEAKSTAHFSIGSCSLHEPDEDLSRLP